MGYKRVKQPKISDVIMQELEGMILEGTLKPGQKLPPERELAEQFEVSRPSLREAIQKLAARGLLQSRQGGGTYVSEQIGSFFTDPLMEMLSSHDEFHYDVLEFRDALEGLSAYYAAIRGTEADHRVITARYQELLATYEQQDPALEAKADAEFHLSIAEAAHNVVLLHTMRGLFNLLAQSIVANLDHLYTKKGSRDILLAQHKALYEAVLAGDAEEARRAAHEHLVFVEDSLLELSKEETRIQRSLRRVQSISPS